MRRIIPLTLAGVVGLAAVGATASADRPTVRDHRGARYDQSRGSPRSDVRPRYRYRPTHSARSARRSYRQPSYSYRQPSYSYRPYTDRRSYSYRPYSYRRSYAYRPSYRYVPQPIYVKRPVIKYRYYDSYRRPALIVENVPRVTGYIWVSGYWYWNGYEWLWQFGYYTPDPAYYGSYGYGSAYRY